MLIQNKLIVWFSALVASILILFSLSVYYFYSLYREQAFYDRLSSKAIINARLMLKSDKLNEEVLKYMERKDLNSLDSEMVNIFNDQDILVYSNSGKEEFSADPDQLEEIRHQKIIKWENGPLEGLGFIYQDNQKNYVLMISAIDREGLKKLENLKLILIVANIISVLVVALTGWLFARAVLYPISEVIKEVNSITAATLSVRVHEGNKKDEIAQLAFTFNRMLDRVQQSYESQKSFVSNASHELRTPMSVLLSELETSYLYDHDLTSSKESIYSATEEIKKLIKLTNGLLNLAKVDDAKSLTFNGKVSLDEIILKCIDETKRAYPSQEISFGFGRIELDIFELEVLGNEELLKMAIGNIIENACKYSNGKGVDITMEVLSNKSVTIKVKDYGLGMDDVTLMRIAQPLFRGERVRNLPGYGIGLSLSKKIITYHQGQLLFESEEDKGTLVTVIFHSV
jgi:signal transduction histidine kinase